MDALSDVLRVVRLTGGVFLDAEFTAPWCVTAKVAPEDCRPFLADPAPVIAYPYVVAGRLFLQVEDAPPTQVRAGEIVLLPRNHAHRLGSSLTLRQSVPPTSSGLRAKADSLASATVAVASPRISCAAFSEARPITIRSLRRCRRC